MENALSISSSGELGERSRGTWAQAKKPLLLATIALTVGAIASRPRATQLGPGVIRTVMKGALYGALSAVPQLLLLRLSKKILSHYERIPPGSAATRSF